MLTQCFIALFSLLILAEMKHHFCWRHTILEGDVQSLELEKLDPNRLKLLQRHILDVSELVVSIGSVRKRPHTAYGAIAFKLP